MNVPTVSLELPPSARSVRIAQLTDMHLEENKGGTLLGMDTDTSLGHVLDLVRTAEQPPHLILATGDLANHGSTAAYLRLKEYFSILPCPTFYLPGNHDGLKPLCDGLCGGADFTRCVLVGGWQIILLNTMIPDKVGGRLEQTELDLLDTLLCAKPGIPTLVCLHHQPVPIGCRWLDDQMVDNSAALFAILDRNPQVRAIIWGHVHQEFSRQHRHMRLLATPSTCIQFAPQRDAFGLDERAPGMRWLELHPDGSMDTRVQRVTGVQFNFDRNSAGYV